MAWLILITATLWYIHAIRNKKGAAAYTMAYIAAVVIWLATVSLDLI